MKNPFLNQKKNLQSPLGEKKWKIYLRRFRLVLGIASMLWYLIWRLFYTLPFGYDALSFTCGIIMLIGETSAFFESLENFQNLSNLTPPEKPIFDQIPTDFLPDIDILIATHNEPTELLRKTVNGCIHMDYPNKNKIHIYLCDDGDRVDVAKMAEEMGVGYFGLSGNTLAKAGNLNNAIFKTTSPLLATFDADMIPMSSFLTSLIPYFLMPLMKKNEEGHWLMRNKEEIDPNWKMGFIQAPQSFYNEDLFQYNLYQEQAVPNEQDYFFREINVGRNRSNAPIYAGSNTIITREALESVGGIVIGTITEDFATGLLIQEKGFSCYAVPEIVANGLAPNTVIDLIKQRERWGRGCVQTVKSQKFLIHHKLPLANKISYWNCFLYWWTFFRRFLYIFSPIMFVLFNLRVMVCDVKGLLVFWLPCFVLFSNSSLFDQSQIRTKRLSNAIDTILFPYMMIPIFLETIGISQHKFNVTKKDGMVSNNSDVRLAIPHLILLTMSMAALLFCIINSIQYKTFGFVIVGYWLLINTYYLIMAVFFMLGRLNQRKYMRYMASLDVTIQTLIGEISCKSVNISEKGICISTHIPIYLPEEEEFLFVVKSDRYQAKMMGTVRHVTSNAERYWLYGIECTAIDEKNELQYYQLIHDREHTLPQYIDRKQINFLQDLSINIIRRQDDNDFYGRKMPRILLNMELKDKNTNTSYYLYDFNYQYVRLFDHGNMPPQLIFLIQLVPGGCTYEWKLFINHQKKRENQLLYRVVNVEELIEQKDFAQDLQVAMQNALEENTEKFEMPSLLIDDIRLWSDVDFC